MAPDRRELGVQLEFRALAIHIKVAFGAIFEACPAVFHVLQAGLEPTTAMDNRLALVGGAAGVLVAGATILSVIQIGVPPIHAVGRHQSRGSARVDAQDHIHMSPQAIYRAGVELRTVEPAGYKRQIRAEARLVHHEPADPGHTRVAAQVSPTDALRILPGNGAAVESGSQGPLVGRVVSVERDGATPSSPATVVLSVAPEMTQPRPGQHIHARIIPTDAEAHVFRVPVTAVQAFGQHPAVFVRTPDGFRVQPVTIGGREGGEVEIVAGLSDGDLVAVTHSSDLKARLPARAGDGAA